MKYYPGFGRLFDDFFNDSFTSQSTGLLKTDIREKDGSYQLSMEVPGCNKEDIQIELSQGYLKVTATRNTNKEEKDESGHMIRQERYSGSASRSFYVGDGYKEEDIKAHFENGELFITLPTEARKIEETKKVISIE
ncbi:MAG: Hsp20/alpha crystallin family protein [Erysipelotrichaceae bacterium]|nr:Hsp20/alpha crystallin family protein [Erysipelotrichaceae bacterium]